MIETLKTAAAGIALETLERGSRPDAYDSRSLVQYVGELESEVNKGDDLLSSIEDWKDRLEAPSKNLSDAKDRFKEINLGEIADALEKTICQIEQDEDEKLPESYLVKLQDVVEELRFQEEELEKQRKLVRESETEIDDIIEEMEKEIIKQC